MSFRLVCLIAVSTFLFIRNSLAQIPIYKDYEWSKNPTVHSITDSDLNDYPAVIISQIRFVELVITNGQANTYDTEHKIIHVINDAGIEKYNKVYIPLYTGRELVSLKVRAVDKSGKITEFNNSNLKELKNVEGYGNFKIFAVEGLSKGGELEYLYTIKAPPQTNGREIIQQDVPVLESDFELVYPDRLKFLAKSYNGLPKVQSGVIDQKRVSLQVSAKNIPALVEEQYSAYKPSLMRVDYKLESNGTTIGMMSWYSICERVLDNLDVPKGESKILKLIKTIDLDNLDEIEKAKKIERYIKTNFTLKEGNNEAYEELKEITTSHVANEQGIAKLYFAIFKALDIQNQVVLTCNRFKGEIDPDFSSFMNLEDVLFYFPGKNSYIVPSIAYLRMGSTPSFLTGSNALFITYHFENNKASYLKYNVKEIEPTDYSVNQEGVKAVVTFGDNMANLTIKQQNFWQGYRGVFYRGIYYYNSGKDKEDFLKSVALSGIDNYSIIKRTVEGDDLELSSDAEAFFKVNTEYNVSSLIEKAGSDYLLSVGKIIGKQSELYQEKERQTDIVFHEISNYNHEIVIQIPKGYTCTGLDAVKINNSVIQNDKPVMYFNSDFSLQGNVLTIHVNEVYKTLRLPKKNYEAFRKMVNSAADFNKIVLVFQPI